MKQIFQVRSMVAMVILILIHTHSMAAPLILPRPVSLQAETFAHLRQAHTNQNNLWQLVFFGFTLCKDFCPTSLANLHMLIQVANEENINLHGTFVTIDPDRDSAAALDSYTKSFGSNIAYLRFENEALEHFKDAFGVEVAFYTKNQGNQQNYQVDHSTTAFLIDPEGRIRIMFDAVDDADSVVELFRGNKELFKL